VARERLQADPVVEELGRLYERAEENLRKSVKRAIDSKALGTARYREEQLQVVRAYLSAVQDRAVPLGTKAVATAYRQQALAVDVTVPGATGGFGGVHAEAATALADNLANSLNDAAELVGRQVDDVFRKVGLEQTALGVLEGKSRIEVTKAIVDDLLHEAVTGFVDNGGRRWTLQSYGKMVARTTTREAASAGTKNRMDELGLQLIDISSHADPCDICAHYDGNTYALPGESVEGYEAIDELPPFHPNCRHVTTASAANLELLTGGAVTA
jgi:hypothetical protein